MTKNNTAIELNDAALEAANGGVNINNDYMPMFGGEVAVQIDNNHMPVSDAVIINGDHRMTNSWMPVTEAVNINNDY